MKVEVSVLLSVYNGEKNLKETIESILRQTFSEFEFIIVDDGSTDQTANILKIYCKQDERIKIISNRSRNGFTMSLNIGLRCCTGRYIARLDADEIADSQRLEKQYLFMENNPNIVLCGSQGFYIDELGNKTGEKDLPVTDEAIKAKLLFNNQFIHSSLFLRKNILDKEGVYNESFITSQDYELILRLAAKYKMINLSDRLIGWRVKSNSISWTSKRQEWDAIRARWWAITRYGYPKIIGFINIILRFGWLILPQKLKIKRYL